MKRTMLSTVVGLAILAGGCADQMTTLRVLTYNIHHGRGADGEVNLERIADVIRRSEADLVALQEVDCGVERSGRINQPARLAELTGLHAVFEKNIDYQGGQYGNAILSRYAVESHENLHLPSMYEGEQRGLLQVRVKVNETSVVFCSTHWDYRGDDKERMACVPILDALMRKQPDFPVIVAGDFNALPDSRVMLTARELMIDAWNADSGEGFTFPAGEPVRRIDYVLHSPGVRSGCVESRVLPEVTASDHRPVLVVLEVKGNP